MRNKVSPIYLNASAVLLLVSTYLALNEINIFESLYIKQN